MRLRDLCGLIAALAMLLMAHSAHAFPWSIDMFRGQSVQPLAQPPRNMPLGTLPVHGGEPPMTREQADGTLKNPLKPTAAHLKHGKQLFDTDCAPCHGENANGFGPVAFLMIVPPPDLTKAQPAERSDGYLYATIRNGSYVMPAYGDAMSIDERWEVVLYMRKLQGKLNAQ